MNKKNILVSGLSIMFLVGLIGFTTSLAAAAPWPSVSESPSGQPIELDTGGVGITVSALQYSQNGPITYLNPGQSVLANASVFNSAPGGNSDVNLTVSLDNATIANAALLGMTNAIVWVDTSGTGTETAPTSNDYVLTPTGLVQTSAITEIPLTSTMPISGTMLLPHTITATNAYVVNYGLLLDGTPVSGAEGQQLKVGASLTGSQL